MKELRWRRRKKHRCALPSWPGMPESARHDAPACASTDEETVLSLRTRAQLPWNQWPGFYPPGSQTAIWNLLTLKTIKILAEIPAPGDMETSAGQTKVLFS